MAGPAKKRLTASLLTDPVHFFALGFGSGLSPRAPGTVGTLAAAPIAFVLLQLPALVAWIVVAIAIAGGIRITGVSAERLGTEAADWASRFMHLPKPYTGLILGGNSGPYTFGAKAADSIARQASRMAAQRNGALLISTSARRPKSVVKILKQVVSVPHYLYQWQANGGANPYFGILALSDELIVTADSVSMLSEACATGKPVYMAELGGYNYPMRPGRKTAVDFRLSALTYSWMMRFGPKRLSRDLRLVHNKLLAEARVAWLGDSLQQRSILESADMAHALQRVRALFGYP